MKKRVSLLLALFFTVLPLFSYSCRETREFMFRDGDPLIRISVYFPERHEDSDGTLPLLLILNAHEYIESFSATLKVMADFGYAPDVILATLQTNNPFSIYTPSQAGIPGGEVIPDSGGGQRLRELLIKEIIPWIEKSYHVSSFRMVYGHSVGGLWVLDDFTQSDPFFSAHAATSPSCWWDDEVLTSRIRSLSLSSRGGTLFMCMGNEGKTMFPPAKRFYEAVIQYDETIQASFLSFETTDHQMIPVIAFSHSMAFLFSD